MATVDTASRNGAETAPPPFEGGAARLVGLTGEVAGRTFPIGKRSLLIGRAPDADICLSSGEISLHHATVEVRGNGLMVRDLGSRNGTAVNGVLVADCALHPGDRIHIGSTILMLSQQDDLELRANRLQKLDSLARLATGLVHDFRNTLSVVLVNTELLSEQLVPGSTVTPDVADILREVMDAARASLDVTQRLRSFARRNDAVGVASIKVSALVDDALAMVRRSFQVASKVRITVDIDPRLAIRGNAEELGHAVLALALNARDAMPEGGDLKVQAIARTFKRSDALALHLPMEGIYVDLIVSDTGTGMTDEVQARLFEPFFTTKPAGAGTGLGLSTAYGVIRNHGGNLTCESVPDKGSRFRVLLPAAT